MSAPIQLEGPCYGRRRLRRHRLAVRALLALRTAAVVVAVVAGMPMVAGLLYGLVYGH